MSIASKILELAREIELEGFCVSDINIALTKDVIAHLYTTQLFRVNSTTDDKGETRIAGVKIIEKPKGK